MDLQGLPTLFGWSANSGQPSHRYQHWWARIISPCFYTAKHSLVPTNTHTHTHTVTHTYMHAAAQPHTHTHTHTDRHVNAKHWVLIDSGAAKCQRRHRRSYRGALWNSDVLEIMIVPNLALCVCVCVCVRAHVCSSYYCAKPDRKRQTNSNGDNWMDGHWCTLIAWHRLHVKLQRYTEGKKINTSCQCSHVNTDCTGRVSKC